MREHRDMELRQEEARLEELLELAKVDVRAPAELKARVMERISSAGSPSPIRRLSDILLRPYRVMLTPAHGLGLAVAVAAVVALWPIDAPSSGTEPRSGGVATHFVFVDPRVSSVQLTGDFTAWSREGIPLRDVNGSGVWVADVALPPGVYQYVFIVDGEELRADPQAAAQVDDGFGQTNSIVMVSSDGEA